MPVHCLVPTIHSNISASRFTDSRTYFFRWPLFLSLPVAWLTTSTGCIRLHHKLPAQRSASLPHPHTSLSLSPTLHKIFSLPFLALLPFIFHYSGVSKVAGLRVWLYHQQRVKCSGGQRGSARLSKPTRPDFKLRVCVSVFAEQPPAASKEMMWCVSQVYHTHTASPPTHTHTHKITSRTGSVSEPACV